MYKKLFILLVVLGIAGRGVSQVFPTEDILNNGPSDKMVDLVFLSDGYTAGQMIKFRNDVQDITAKMFSQTPFKQYKNYINVIVIKVPSNESGASHPKTAPDCGSTPVAVVDNYFGSTFDVGNIHRLLVASNASKVASVLAATYPQYDQAFVLVNSSIYGGSGGQFATSSTDPSAAETTFHEIGHSFAKLSDEYWAGPSYAFEQPNLTQQGNPAFVKWKNWVGTNEVGVYPHAESPTWYRPHQNCKMRFLNIPFCSVCVENFVERIQNLTNPIQSFSPASGPVALAPTIPFTVALTLPDPNTIQTTWKLNGAVIATNANTLNISKDLFVQKQNEVKVQVLDDTGFSRIGNKATAHLRVLTWTVANPDGTDPVVTGVEVIASEGYYKVEAYPNPIQDKLRVSYDLSQEASVRLVFTDVLGRKLTEAVNERQQGGTHTYDFNPDNLNIRSGDLYIMRLEIDGAVITKKIVRE